LKPCSSHEHAPCTEHGCRQAGEQGTVTPGRLEPLRHLAWLRSTSSA
jgi:hypothetical protein